MLKSHKQVREARGIDLKINPDSVTLDRVEEEEANKERSERVYLPLQVNKNLAESLPFK